MRIIWILRSTYKILNWFIRHVHLVARLVDELWGHVLNYAIWVTTTCVVRRIIDHMSSQLLSHLVGTID